MIIERSTYKDRPVIIFKRNEEDKWPLSIGVSKAKVFLENIDEIQKFVDENDNAPINKPKVEVSKDDLPY